MAIQKIEIKKKKKWFFNFQSAPSNNAPSGMVRCNVCRGRGYHKKPVRVRVRKKN